MFWYRWIKVLQQMGGNVFCTDTFCICMLFRVGSVTDVELNLNWNDLQAMGSISLCTDGLLCVSQATSTHGFISPGNLCFHWLGFQCWSIDSFYAEIKLTTESPFSQWDFLTDVSAATEILEYFFILCHFRSYFWSFFFPPLQYSKSMPGSPGELVA